MLLLVVILPTEANSQKLEEVSTHSLLVGQENVNISFMLMDRVQQVVFKINNRMFEEANSYLAHCLNSAIVFQVVSSWEVNE